MSQVSNDHLDLTPQPPPAGPTLTFDFPGMLVGVAEYPEGPTGCTVFSFPAGVPLATPVKTCRSSCTVIADVSTT